MGITVNAVNKLLFNQYWNRKSIDEVLKPIVKDTDGKSFIW